MNIFNKLSSIEHLSSNERIIAEYILKHPDEVLKLNAKDLASQNFVSMSTVYRLCDKLDLSGYSELKLEISSSITSYLKGKDFDYNFPVKPYQTHYEILNNLKEDYYKTVESTFGYFDLEELRVITNAMINAKQIDIYTSAGNIYFAQNFRFQMAEIGQSVRVPVDEYEQGLTAASGDKDHLAIMISFGGRGLKVRQIAHILHTVHTPILLISSPDLTSIKADYQLSINPYEDHYKKISSFSTRLSILYILDVLYTTYFERNYDENLEKKIKYYHTLSLKE